VTRPSDALLWRCVEDTLTTIVEPVLPVGYERDSARQLTGLARYALARTSGADAERAAELGPLLGCAPDAGLPDVLAQAARVLVDGAPDARVRAILVRQLAEDVAEAAPLLETFSGHTPVDDEPDPADVPESDRLLGYLSAALGQPIDEFSVALMVGGHSRRMLDVRLRAAGERLAFVVRVEQGGMFGTDGSTEARAMSALAAAGFPVAPVRWIETEPDVLGQPFFVMDRVPGTVSADDAMLDAYVRALHGLHQVEPGQLVAGLGPVPPSPEAGVQAAIDPWARIYRDNAPAPIPLLEQAEAWLRRHLRPTGPVSVVHGDPGPGNFLHDGRAITALTDWELVHYGDPAEDWTYFGAIRARRVHDAGIWRQIFATQTGVDYDDVTWDCWLAFNLYKGACVNLTALRLFCDGVSTRPNVLAIGTAVQLRFLTQLVERIDALRPILEATDRV
jgi:aminoglycoside phosphotransferase (APT) family kinase protein